MLEWCVSTEVGVEGALNRLAESCYSSEARNIYCLEILGRLTSLKSLVPGFQSNNITLESSREF